MRFLYAFAGIPQVIYEDVLARKQYIAQDDGEFFGAALRRDTYGYTSEYLDIFVREFAKRIANDHHRQLDDVGFAVIYISFGEHHDKYVESRFFPSTLTIPVDWQLPYGTPTEVRAAKNRLVELLHGATRQAKAALDTLRNEATKRSNKTPLLLPLRNFRSAHFTPRLQELSKSIRTAADKQTVISQFVSAIEAAHPPQPVPVEGRRKVKLEGFVDEHKVLFAPPGRNRHAFARPASSHPSTCLLAGRRRLGAPFDPAFHYDCTLEGAQLSGDFYGCHEPPSRKVGDPHLNIAPNDFVRA